MARIVRPGPVVLMAAVALVAVVGAIVAIMAPVASGQDGNDACVYDQGAAQPPGSGDLGTLTVWKEPCALPEPVAFTDGSGNTVTLESFRGKTVVLNLWATWCPPCLREMPALDRLQAAMGGDSFTVVALNQDRGGVEVARKWLEDKGLTHLAVYADPKGAVTRALKAPGLPTTVILDPQGHEIARLMGEAEWDSEDMQDTLRGLMQAGNG